MGKMKFGKSTNQPVMTNKTIEAGPSTITTIPSNLTQEQIDNILNNQSELFERLAKQESVPLATMKMDSVKEVFIPVYKPDSKARMHSRLMRKELDKKVQELNKRLDVQQGCGCSTTVENKYDDSELKKLINELRSEVYVINQFEKNAPSVIHPPQEKQSQSKLIYVAIGLSILSILITFIK